MLKRTALFSRVGFPKLSATQWFHISISSSFSKTCHPHSLRIDAIDANKFITAALSKQNTQKHLVCKSSLSSSSFSFEGGLKIYKLSATQNKSHALLSTNMHRSPQPCEPNKEPIEGRFRKMWVSRVGWELFGQYRGGDGVK